MFTLNFVVIGNGFFARVTSNGRALATKEKEGFWVDGVAPGAIAEGGETIKAALDRFRNCHELVLFDMAAEADSIENFKQQVSRWFFATDAATSDAWDSARAAVRVSGLSLDGFEKVREDIEPTIVVVELESNPKQNEPTREIYKEAA